MKKKKLLSDINKSIYELWKKPSKNTKKTSFKKLQEEVAKAINSGLKENTPYEV